MDSTIPTRPHRTVHADIPFIHLLRAIAVSLVLYDHLVGSYLETWKKMDWLPKQLIDTYIIAPFGIIQSFGFMGVSLFFLVSGYIITHVASNESRSEFLIKRIFRIYPPLIVSIVICLLFGKWIAVKEHSLGQILLNFTLLNYLDLSPSVIQGVAWSLLIEVEFYFVTLAFLPMLKRWPCRHVIVQSVLVGACIASCHDYGPRFFLFSAGFAYLPYLMIGQLWYYRQHERIPTRLFLPLFLLQMALIQWGLRSIHTQFLPIENSYLINFSYSLTLFFLLSLSNIKKLARLPKGMAEISYSLYLLHGSVGVGSLNMLTPRLPYTPSLLIALALLFVAAALSFRFIEKPSQKLARVLINIRHRF